MPNASSTTKRLNGSDRTSLAKPYAALIPMPLTTETLNKSARPLVVEFPTNAEQATSWMADNIVTAKLTARGARVCCHNVYVRTFGISAQFMAISREELLRTLLVKIIDHLFDVDPFAAIQCERPQNPLNGRAIYDSVSYNSLISYECNYGYMLIGDSVRRCERNKMWTGTEPTCKGLYPTSFIMCLPPLYAHLSLYTFT